ncbi:phage integrase central domain-containing protein [Novosphingobium guangzhouense]|uniref:phage integrase central domain-containing protein n=1 Tax=Novosphingobium guangzhouense TaxID=1850347 RepID=UPI003CCBB8C4
MHAGDILRSFECDVFPAIGDLPIAELTPPKIIQILRSVEERHAIESARRLRQRISAVFVYAIACSMKTSQCAAPCPVS